MILARNTSVRVTVTAEEESAKSVDADAAHCAHKVHRTWSMLLRQLSRRPQSDGRARALFSSRYTGSLCKEGLHMGESRACGFYDVIACSRIDHAMSG